jgi:hypothetical protein
MAGDGEVAVEIDSCTPPSLSPRPRRLRGDERYVPWAWDEMSRAVMHLALPCICPAFRESPN